MSSFLDDFKLLINPLTDLLTKVITSLLDKKIMYNNTFIDKFLSIVLFNGLKNDTNEFQIYLYNKRINIEHLMETHFIQYLKIYIPGYKLIKTNHPDNTAHGGIAILVKSIILFQVLPNFCQDFFNLVPY